MGAKGLHLDGIVLYDIAEAIAGSCEERGTLQVDLTGGGYVEIKYEKGAECDVEPETGCCNVSGAWCNIQKIEVVDDDMDARPVDCDIEKLESLAAEYMNN